MELWQLYLITLFPAMAEILIPLVIFSGIGVIISWVVVTINGMEVSKNKRYELERDYPQDQWAFDYSKKARKVSTIIFALSMVAMLFVPDADRLKVIVGGYFVTNIEGVADLPPNLVAAVNEWLQSQTSGDQ